MSRYTGASYRKSRRLGFSILENGKELAKKPYAPGLHLSLIHISEPTRPY